jgi:hypothetical protein
MWDFVMDKNGARAAFLRELRFSLPIYIPSPSGLRAKKKKKRPFILKSILLIPNSFVVKLQRRI